MNRPQPIRVGLVCLALVGFVPTATLAQRLFVGNDNSPGAVAVYNLPVTAAAPIAFSIVTNNVTAVGTDLSGNMAAGDNAGNVKFFPAPLSGSSVATASFSNGGGNNGAIVFTPAGDFFVSTVSVTGVNKFTHPFSNASVPTQTISNAGLTSPIGLVLDGSQNLYISNSAGGGGNIFVYAPPYTGAPIITPAVAGTAYRKMTIIGSQLFVCSVAPGIGRVDVYSLPLTGSSTPAFSITNGVNTPEAASADVGGNLYIGNLTNSTVTVYSAPYSAVSAPITTQTVSGGTFAIFATAIDNSGTLIPAIGHLGMLALFALLLVVGLITLRSKT